MHVSGGSCMHASGGRCMGGRRPLILLSHRRFLWPGRLIFMTSGAWGAAGALGRVGSWLVGRGFQFIGSIGLPIVGPYIYIGGYCGQPPLTSLLGRSSHFICKRDLLGLERGRGEWLFV